MPYENFRRDLKIGEQAEATIRGILEEAGFTTEDGPHDYSYDFLAKQQRANLVEVKNESKYADSGNIVVELYIGQNRRPSGITKSDASIYIHYMGDYCVVYKKSKMMMYVIYLMSHGELQNNLMYFAKGDDNVCGLLLKQEDLINGEIAFKVDTKDLASLDIWRT